MWDKLIWFFSELITKWKQFKAWDKVEIQIMRSGEWNHVQYWKVSVNEKVIDEVITNFNDNKRGIDLVVDENHEPDHKALALFKEIYKKWSDALFASLELTTKGAKLLSEWAYMYFSPEIIFWPKRDEETGELVSNLLTWGAFTNRPFFKKMSPLMANEATDKQQDDPIFLSIIAPTMNMFKELLQKAKAQKVLSFSEKFELQKAFNDLPEEEKTDETKQEVETEVSKPETEEKKPDAKKVVETPTNEKPLQAGETVSVEKYNEAMTRLATLEAESRQQTVEKEFNEQFAFSESNKKGFLNVAKHKDAFVNFTMTLNKEQKASFYEILGNVESNIAEKFSEIGTDANKTTSITDDGQKYNEAVKKVMKEKGIDYDAAVDVVNAQS